MLRVSGFEGEVQAGKPKGPVHKLEELEALFILEISFVDANVSAHFIIHLTAMSTSG
jgi:hypothetical protein